MTPIKRWVNRDELREVSGEGIALPTPTSIIRRKPDYLHRLSVTRPRPRGGAVNLQGLLRFVLTAFFNIIIS